MHDMSKDKNDSPNSQPVNKDNYLFLAALLEGKDSLQRVQKKVPHGTALRAAAEMYENRDYVAAYEAVKPAYEKTIADMQRVLARNAEFEANKLAREQHKPLPAAKEHVQKMKAYAQQVIDQFDRLLHDLERKALVRMHLKKQSSTAAGQAPATEEAPPTTLNSASETLVEALIAPPSEITIGNRAYTKAAYVPPEIGALYCVRDKSHGERIIRIVNKSPDGSTLQVEVLKQGRTSKLPVEVAKESLTRQAAKGWCSSLRPIDNEQIAAARSRPATSDPNAIATMRLDIQNFSRCCADIVRANIKFDTQRIKDVCDGPFRAGDFEQAFLTFEQFATGFNTAVASSRRAIADGRQALIAQKGTLSGKEIQDRNAAFTRSEHLIHTAEREFSTILEGLRMYLRAQQG